MIRWHNVVRGHFCIKWVGTRPALALQLKLSPSLFFRKSLYNKIRPVQNEYLYQQNRLACMKANR